MQTTSLDDLTFDSIKLVIHGPAGTGKTTLASTTEEKTLIVSAESGLLCLKKLPKEKKELIEVWDITRENGELLSEPADKMRRLEEIGALLLTKEYQNKFSWVMVDSYTEIGQVVFETIKSSDAKFKDPKNNLVLWGLFAEKMRAITKFFRDLNGYHIVFTALSKKDKNEHGYSVYGVDLQGKISDQLPGYFDEVFYYKKEKHIDEETKQEVEKRYLCTSGSETDYVAKDRSGVLDKIEEPNLSAIKRKILGGN